MGVKLPAEGLDCFPTSIHQRKDEEFDWNRGSLLDFSENCGVMDHGNHKDVVKQAILHQETIFRHQVFELHRLYWTQKNLVKNFNCNDHGEDANYSEELLQIPREMEEKKIGFLSQKNAGSSKHGLAHSMNYQGQHNIANDRHPRRNLSICSDVVIDLEAVDLMVDVENNNVIGGVGTHLSNKQWCYPHERDLIDLNKAADFMSSEEREATSSCSVKTPIPCAEIMCESQLPALSDVTSCERTSKDSGCMLFGKLLHAGQNEIRRIQLSDSTKRSYRAVQFEFDLNMVQLEESSSTLDQPPVMLSSASAGSPATSHGGTGESLASTHPTVNISRESSNVCLQETASASKVAPMNCYTEGIIDFSEVLHSCDIKDSHESIEVPCRNCHDGKDDGNLISIRSDSNKFLASIFCKNYKDTDSPLATPSLNNRMVHSITDAKGLILHSSPGNAELLCLTRGASEAKQVEGEKSEEDTLSSTTKLVNVDAYAPVEISLSTTHIQDFTVSEDYGIIQNNTVATDSYVVLKDPFTKVCEHIYLQETSEVDSIVLRAAESLVDIFIKDSACPLGSCAQVGQINSEVEKTYEQPQYSSHSLESMVLALPETKENECSSLPWVTEKEMVKEDTYRLKSRSGRRLRDFQRDILPGLLSLSRYEICEDLHAFQEIFKVNELSKKGNGKVFKEKWNNTIRSRRSRLYPVGRRW